MTLRLYNTLTKAKDVFAPIDAKNVRMYVCGPTVYDFAHIGNARPAIVFDVLFRLLRHEYGAGHVTYARNITDVDDKINARAAEVAAAKGIPVEQARAQITALTEQQYVEDVTALGCLSPDKTPRATENIAPMIAVIESLIAAGHAYAAQGHVLFDVASKPDYGKLSRRSLDEMIAGSRVEVAPYKKSPMDFVLWKPSDDHTPGWDSPWGRGRPGWHIECSAMIAAGLGDTIDIHGGGIDLVFPHHENEIAQSEGAHHGHPLANVWMHNGFLLVEGEKMSKSAGNFLTIRALLRGWHGEAWSGSALRFTMLKAHYTKPINWTLDELSRSKFELAHFVGLIRKIPNADFDKGPSNDLLKALRDDLNTPEAITVLRAQCSSALEGDNACAQALASNLKFLGLIKPESLSAYVGDLRGKSVAVRDLIENEFLYKNLKAAVANNDVQFIDDLKTFLREKNIQVKTDEEIFSVSYLDGSAVDETPILAAISARQVARKAKNFAESDRIRDDLLAQGIVLKDGSDGTTWELKK